jgi:hypothetical protein
MAPFPDAERDANAAVLCTLPPPFRAWLDMTQPGGPEDGWLSWTEPILANKSVGLPYYSSGTDHPRPLTLPRVIPPGGVPLEVGNSPPSRTALHMYEEFGVARWPYESTMITIFISSRYPRCMWDVPELADADTRSCRGQGSGLCVCGVPAEAPCAKFHKPFPRERVSAYRREGTSCRAAKGYVRLTVPPTGHRPDYSEAASQLERYGLVAFRPNWRPHTDANRRSSGRAPRLDSFQRWGKTADWTAGTAERDAAVLGPTEGQRGDLDDRRLDVAFTCSSGVKHDR